MSSCACGGLQAEGFDNTQDPDSAPASPASTSGSSDAAPQADIPSEGPLGGGGGGFSRAEATGDFQSLGAERAKKKSALRECVLFCLYCPLKGSRCTSC